jgi:hypothetical protein
MRERHGCAIVARAMPGWVEALDGRSRSTRIQSMRRHSAVPDCATLTERSAFRVLADGDRREAVPQPCSEAHRSGSPADGRRRSKVRLSRVS